MTTSRGSLIKLLLGVGMIVASVVGVSALVASLTKTHAMVMVETDMPVGHVISASDVRLTDGYVVGSGVTFPQDTADLVGKVTTRPLAAGEIVSDAVVTDAFDLDVTTLVISTSEGVPASLEAGDTIEVWSAGTTDPLAVSDASTMSAAAEPRALAAGEFAARIGDPQVTSLGGTQQVEVIVAKTDVERILSAQAHGESLLILPQRSHTS